MLKLVASLTSHSVGNNNICLDLSDIAGKELLMDGKLHQLPCLEELVTCLKGHTVVGVPGDYRPLILGVGSRLYFHRYWKYEQNVVRFILEKTAAAQADVDEALLEDGLGRFFPPGSAHACDWQKVAAVVALSKKFCVISGGPGTGKTSTVVKIIALLAEQADGRPFQIALAAPTGKAAARLNESIRFIKEHLDCPREIKESIPEDIATIHRLLGSKGNSARFSFSQENVLPFDVVIVDEASMVSLPLMSALVMALRKDARLILLGDKDQLASVEAGSVLGDICGGGNLELFSQTFSDFVARVSGERIPAASPENPLPPLADSLVVLQKNYRFGSESGIGAFALAVNSGEGKKSMALLMDISHPDLKWHDIPPPDMLKKNIAGIIIEGFGTYLKAGSPEEALGFFDAFRVLCAVRRGPYGVTAVNSIIEDILIDSGLIEPNNQWYHGRPVMITVNDYNLNLYNGDMGIMFADKENGGAPLVYFLDQNGKTRSISPVRLPAHETVYALTTHKSQGSEFDKILFLLPQSDTEILTRELIYTGITRAKRAVDVWGNEDVFVSAVSRKVVRKSGLSDQLAVGGHG